MGISFKFKAVTVVNKIRNLNLLKYNYECDLIQRKNTCLLKNGAKFETIKL